MLLRPDLLRALNPLHVDFSATLVHAQSQPPVVQAGGRTFLVLHDGTLVPFDGKR